MRYIDFSVIIDSGLRAERVGASHQIWVKAGENATLQVSASIYWGDILYQWYDDSGLIAGATGASYTVQNINGRRSFQCEVKDRYGNQKTLGFDVRVDNELSFDSYEDVFIFAQPGEDLQIDSNASCCDGELYYQWMASGINAPSINTQWGSNSSLMITNIQSAVSVECSVRDEYGNQISRRFEIRIENGFKANRIGEYLRKVKFGDHILLEVDASCDTGELTYMWRGISSSESLGNSESFLTPAITEDTSFECNIYDQYWNSQRISFSLVVEIETEGSLSAKPIGGSYRYEKLGSDVTLSLDVTGQEGEVTYYWTRGLTQPYSIRDSDIISRNPEYTIWNIQNNRYLTCTISDQSGKTLSIYYVLNVEELIKPLRLNVLTDAMITNPSSFDLFSFIPVESGTYAIEVQSEPDPTPSFGVYATGGNESPKLNGFSRTFYSYYEMELKNGVEYHFRFSDLRPAEIPFRIIQKSTAEENRSLLLQTGQTVQIPVPSTAGDLMDITLGDESLLTVAGSMIQAKTTGSTTVSFVFENKKVNYSVTVLPEESGMKYPSALTTIENEAFFGDESIKFAELGGSVMAIGRQAFAGSGLQQIIIQGSQTEIAIDSFESISPQIICVPGSKAEQFAKQHGYDYVFLP